MRLLAFEPKESGFTIIESKALQSRLEEVFNTAFSLLGQRLRYASVGPL